MRFVFYSVLCDNLPCARPHASASLHAFSFQQARRLVEWCVGRRVGKFWGCFSTFFPLFALPRTPICGRKYSDIETNNSPSSCIITYKITQKNPFRNKNSTLFKTFSYALKNNILHTSKHPPRPHYLPLPQPLTSTPLLQPRPKIYKETKMAQSFSAWAETFVAIVLLLQKDWRCGENAVSLHAIFVTY